MPDATIGAVILATDDTGFSGPAELGGQSAPLVELAGRPLVSRVVKAVRASGRIRQVVMVGGKESAHAPFGADLQLAASASPSANIESGLAALNGCSHAVLLPGNLPFLTGEELEVFLAAALDAMAHVVYPMIALASCQAHFPELRPRSFRLAEGEVTGGHALFVHTETFLARPQIIEQVIEVRRDPWKLAGMVGPLVLLSFGMGRLTLDDIAQTAGKALGIQVAAIIADAPSLAIDIRKPIDVRVARERLGKEE